MDLIALIPTEIRTLAMPVPQASGDMIFLSA